MADNSSDGANIQGANAAGAATAATASTSIPPVPSQHAPNLAGSVIEASDGLGGEKLLIRIQNMASTATFGVRLDLKKIALKCRNTEYNPRRFAAVIMRLREPRATALIFASGKLCVTGVKSTHNATLAAKKFAYIIERIGFKPKEFMDFKVQNIVGTAGKRYLRLVLLQSSAFASFSFTNRPFRLLCVLLSTLAKTLGFPSASKGSCTRIRRLLRTSPSFSLDLSTDLSALASSSSFLSVARSSSPVPRRKRICRTHLQSSTQSLLNSRRLTLQPCRGQRRQLPHHHR